MVAAGEDSKHRRDANVCRKVSYVIAAFFSILTIGAAFALGFTAPS